MLSTTVTKCQVKVEIKKDKMTVCMGSNVSTSLTFVNYFSMSILAHKNSMLKVNKKNPRTIMFFCSKNQY